MIGTRIASNVLYFYVASKRGQNSIGVSFQLVGGRTSTGLDWFLLLKKDLNCHRILTDPWSVFSVEI